MSESSLSDDEDDDDDDEGMVTVGRWAGQQDDAEVKGRSAEPKGEKKEKGEFSLCSWPLFNICSLFGSICRNFNVKHASTAF